ncbi:hypothetical protein ACJVC5_19390 [Peredibacter sp. HCB2-198]|uniref:hypothetical protein n=1 Tax=Peredibacter sp. HCB2-198 TaxID=3383025 RepID=UPI0038B433C0
MKLAIIGHSPLALETALRFHLHGAALTWYVDQDNLEHFTSANLPNMHFTSDLGLGVLKEIGRTYAPSNFSWKEWTENYAAPLMTYLRAHQELKTDEVISVTKRFLAPGEKIEGRSRFLDLFRVIFKVNPKDFIEEQRETNPETYQRLTEEFVNSLASSIEMYQDYDLVLDLRSDLGKSSAAASGRALGESRPTDKASYALAALANASSFKPNPDLRELALIGSDSLAAEMLLHLEEWLKETRSRLFIVTTEEEPFSQYMKVAHPMTAEKLTNLFKYIDDEFQKEIDVFTKKLHEWQQLDDFVQVKIPKPAEPIPRLVYFSGHNVSAIDELIDKKRMFLTLERPEFRHGKKHPENNYQDLKTIGVDHILVSHGKKDLSFIQLDPNEQGYFALTPSRPNVRDSWISDLEKVKGIEDEIFKLFSPADSH